MTFPRTTGNSANPARTVDPSRAPHPRSMPTGWPVGSFASYEEAEQAVNVLVAEPGIPATALTIVGLNPVEVEHVVGRVTWLRLLVSTLVQSVVLGLLIGVFFSMTGEDMYQTMTMAVSMTVLFGLVVTFLPALLAPRRKKFLTRTELVASRYDVVCDPAHARAARDIVSAWLAGTPRNTTGRP